MLARFRENLVYKLLALGFAIALHLYVAGQENPVQTRTVLVPLTARGLSPGLLFDARSAPLIAVTLSGPADLVNHLPESDVTATVDLSRASAGRNAPKAIRVTLPPSGIGVSAEAQPGAVAVTLSAKAKRSILITASSPGTPPVGFHFRPARVTPRYALLEGSREGVDSVQQVVANVDGGGSIGTIEDDFPVVALDGQGAQVNGVTVTPTSARVRIEMGRVPAAKTLIVSADIVALPPYPYRVTGVDISPQDVTVAGRPELLSQAYTVQTAPIDLSGTTSDVTRQVLCVPPAGLAVAGTGRVTVTIHIAPPSVQAAPQPPATGTPPPTAAPPVVVTPNEPRPQLTAPR